MSPPAGENAVMTFGAAGSPPVLLLHPWWGITPAVTEWAADLAAVGRRVLVPDLYGGRTAATIDEAEALSEAALTDDATFGFIQRRADELAAQEHPWTAMGFSMGGFLACSLGRAGSSRARRADSVLRRTAAGGRGIPHPPRCLARCAGRRVLHGHRTRRGRGRLPGGRI
jgi:dienelactone hydrolase